MDLINILSMGVVTIIVALVSVVGAMRWLTHATTTLTIIEEYPVYRWELVCYATHILTLLVCGIASITLLFFTLTYGFSASMFMVNALCVGAGLTALSTRFYKSVVRLFWEMVLIASCIFITYAAVTGVTLW